MTETTTNGRFSPVLICCTVLRILFRKPEIDPSFFTSVANLVKVRTDSKLYGVSPKTVGTVLGVKEEDGPGWTFVSFLLDSGKEYKNRFRTGGEISLDNGACDLEPAEQEQRCYASINLAGQLFEVFVPFLGVEPGDTLKLEKSTMKVVAFEKMTPSGGIAFVSRIINDTVAEVDYTGGRRTVFIGKFAGKLETNGRVVLDQSGSVIVENFGLDDDSFRVDGATHVSWEDIKGQEEAIEALQMSIELPQRKPEYYKFLGLKPSAGFLLYGPPGCSKTMLAKAVYTSVMETCKEKGIENPSGGFLLVSGPEILDKFVGVPEALIRHLFAKALIFYKRTGFKATIVIDECEAILAKRDSGISSDVLRTIVPAFIAQMQGVKESGAIVILLTNKPEVLDSAAIRDGRINDWIEVKRPTREVVRAIFLNNMKGVPVSGTTSLEKLADLCVERLFSPELAIFEINRSGQESPIKFTLANIVSGAMIPAIVESAQRLALKRELQKSEPSEGVREEDVCSAVQQKFERSFASDHEEALRDFAKDFKDVVGIQKLKQVRV